MKSDLELKFNSLLKKPIKSIKEIEELEELGRKLEQEYKKETVSLLVELKKVGLEYDDIWEMVNSKESYPGGIDILINHLSYPYHDKNKEAIVRALAVKEAKGKATPFLISEYNKIPKEKTNLRWVIGNTVYITITEKDLESVFEIVRNKTNGVSRGMFIIALSKFKSEKSENSLIALLDDEEVTMYVLKALKKMKLKKAKPKISSLLTHHNAEIKKEALKVLNEIDRN